MSSTSFYSKQVHTKNRYFCHFKKIKTCSLHCFGTGCPLGFYSMDCAKPCPHGCRHCSFLYGTCLGGCNPGFEGHHCDIYRRSE